MNKALDKAELERKFLSLCANNGVTLASILAGGDDLGWYVIATIQNRKFLFQTDIRDGYTFDECVGSEYLHYSLGSNEPYRATDERLLALSLAMIQAALVDPEFRGNTEPVI